MWSGVPRLQKLLSSTSLANNCLPSSSLWSDFWQTFLNSLTHPPPHFKATSQPTSLTPLPISCHWVESDQHVWNPTYNFQFGTVFLIHFFFGTVRHLPFPKRFSPWLFRPPLSCLSISLTTLSLLTSWASSSFSIFRCYTVIRLSLILSFSHLIYFPSSSNGKESACNAGDPGSIPGSGRSPGEGNGNPLQYSCLENPVDRGAWRATVHGMAKSQTQLKWLSTNAQGVSPGYWESTRAAYNPGAVWLSPPFSVFPETTSSSPAGTHLPLKSEWFSCFVFVHFPLFCQNLGSHQLQFQSAWSCANC